MKTSSLIIFKHVRYSVLLVFLVLFSSCRENRETELIQVNEVFINSNYNFIQTERFANCYSASLNNQIFLLSIEDDDSSFISKYELKNDKIVKLNEINLFEYIKIYKDSIYKLYGFDDPESQYYLDKGFNFIPMLISGEHKLVFLLAQNPNPNTIIIKNYINKSILWVEFNTNLELQKVKYIDGSEVEFFAIEGGETLSTNDEGSVTINYFSNWHYNIELTNNNRLIYSNDTSHCITNLLDPIDGKEYCLSITDDSSFSINTNKYQISNSVKLTEFIPIKALKANLYLIKISDFNSKIDKLLVVNTESLEIDSYSFSNEIIIKQIIPDQDGLWFITGNGQDQVNYYSLKK